MTVEAQMPAYIFSKTDFGKLYFYYTYELCCTNIHVSLQFEISFFFNFKMIYDPIKFQNHYVKSKRIGYKYH